MLYRHQYNDLIWIDSEHVTEEEVSELAQEYGLEHALAQELLVENIKPTLRVFPDHLYFALHFPALKHTHAESQRQEIDFIVGRNVIITNRYDTIDAIHKFSKSFEVETITNPEGSVIDNTPVVLFAILRKLYRASLYELEHQQNELLEIESSILAGYERDMVTRLSRESLDLLTIEQVLSGHREILTELSRETANFFGDEFSEYAQAIDHEYERVVERSRRNRELLNELRRTNDALLQTKQNEISKNLTIIATVTLPLLIIADILSANFEYMPLMDHPHGFSLSLAIMFLTSALAFVALKAKRWF